MKKLALLLVVVIAAGALVLWNLHGIGDETVPAQLKDMFGGALTEDDVKLRSAEVAASRDPVVFQSFALDGVSEEALLSTATVSYYRPGEAEYAACVEEYIEAHQDTFSGIADMLSAAQSDGAILFVDIPEPDDATLVLFDELNSTMFFLRCTY